MQDILSANLSSFPTLSLSVPTRKCFCIFPSYPIPRPIAAAAPSFSANLRDKRWCEKEKRGKKKHSSPTLAYPSSDVLPDPGTLQCQAKVQFQGLCEKVTLKLDMPMICNDIYAPWNLTFDLPCSTLTNRRR